MKLTGDAVAHFGVDFCCGLLLFRFFAGHPQWIPVLLVYNFCAFALQLPFGILADRLNRNRLLAGLGMGMVAAAFLFPRQLFLSIALAGCGNGLFHIGCGVESLNQSVHKAFRLGCFVAPGALGLFLGIQWGKSALPLWPLPCLLALGSVAFLLWGCKPGINAPPSLGRLPLAFWGLFGVVILRSYLGFCIKYPWNNTFFTALLLAFATMLGKMAGGFLMDRLGYLPTALLSLLPAAGCTLFPAQPILGVLGLICFQMTMPLTLWAAGRCCPGAKGFSFGLLTFGLFLGFLPVILNLPITGGAWIPAGILLSLLLLLPGRRLT